MTAYDLYDVLAELGYGMAPKTRGDWADAFAYKQEDWLKKMPVATAAVIQAIAGQFTKAGTEGLDRTRTCSRHARGPWCGRAGCPPALAPALGSSFRDKGKDVRGVKGNTERPSEQLKRIRHSSVSSDDSLYQLHIVLADSNPPIWRRIHGLGDITLVAFHRIMQATMGYKNRHLHEFEDRRGNVMVRWPRQTSYLQPRCARKGESN